MEIHHKTKIIIDLEKLNTLNPDGCPACGKIFELGEPVVLSCGKWEGKRYIHEDEAILDKKTSSYYEKGYLKETGR
jgi:hypothetical protein